VVVAFALPERDGEISAEQIASWYTPLEAAAYASIIVGDKAASNAIWQLLIAGMIEAAASNSSMTPQDRAPIAEKKPALIPKRFWKSISQTGTDLWSGGYARFWIHKGYDGKPTAYQCFGIKLNPSDVRSTLPPMPPESERRKWVKKPAEAPKTAALPPAQPIKEINRGGRPRKDWWDDFWIDICGQIYEGKLIPKTQADLERAMLGWAENRNHEMSEATAKVAARKLFKAWKLGG
jgi:hypothetical protein